MITDLGSLGGYPLGGDYGMAYSINDNGQVVGASVAGNSGHSFMWDNGVMTDLGPGNAYSINNKGQAVGVGGESVKISV